jgi:hypothetical protein
MRFSLLRGFHSSKGHGQGSTKDQQLREMADILALPLLFLPFDIFINKPD